MKTKLHRIARGLYVMAAMAVGAVPLLVAGTASASLVTSRSVEMSDATLSHANTTYTVSFNTISTASPSIQAIIVDFWDVIFQRSLL